MYNPKREVYQKLAELKGVTVSQSSQNVFNEVPAVTYRVANNAANYSLDNEITRQDIRITVDIFTEDSVTASDVLAKVEAKMREINYRLEASLDVPAPKDALYHVNATFDSVR